MTARNRERIGAKRTIMRKTFHTPLLLIICLAPSFLFWNGCGRHGTSTPDAVATSPPQSSPSPSPAEPVTLAGPVTENGLEVTIVGARQVGSLSSGSIYGSSYGSAFPSDNRTTYTPKASGMTFLVVDTVFHDLDKSRKELKVSSEKAALIEQSGETIVADGAGTDSSAASSLEKTPESRDYCASCKTSLEVQRVANGKLELEMSFVFVVKSEVINQPLKFRYDKMPPLAFAIVKKEK